MYACMYVCVYECLCMCVCVCVCVCVREREQSHWVVEKGRGRCSSFVFVLLTATNITVATSIQPIQRR